MKIKLSLLKKKLYSFFIISSSATMMISHVLFSAPIVASFLWVTLPMLLLAVIVFIARVITWFAWNLHWTPISTRLEKRTWTFPFATSLRTRGIMTRPTSFWMFGDIITIVLLRFLRTGRWVWSWSPPGSIRRFAARSFSISSVSVRRPSLATYKIWATSLFGTRLRRITDAGFLFGPFKTSGSFSFWA